MTRTFFDFPRRFELSVGDCKKFSHTTQLRLLLRRRRLKSPTHDNYAVQMNELTVFCSLHNISIFTEHKSIFWFHGDTRVILQVPIHVEFISTSRSRSEISL